MDHGLFFLYSLLVLLLMTTQAKKIIIHKVECTDKIHTLQKDTR
jgi:hypothetical protein